MNNDEQPSMDTPKNENDKDESLDKGFDPQKLQNEFRDLIEKKFGGQVQVLNVNDGFPGFDQSGEESSDEAFEQAAEDIINQFQYTPKEIKDHLDRFVIGQSEAKKALSVAICDHYNHLRADRSSHRDQHYQKQNVLVMGPTGVGKTYLVRLISEMIGVPFVKADATRFSEVGYMGANVDDIIRDLVQAAGGDKKLASQGIVYVDEVDKLASKRDQTGRDVSGRGVQFGFLRLLENTDVDLNASHDIASQFKTFMNFQRKGKAEKEIVNTRDILFIFSGAFHGIESIVNSRLNRSAIGLHENNKKEELVNALKQAETKDLVDYGFEHEFIGRLPIRVACDDLKVNDLYNVLTQSEDSILYQYVEAFRHYGIELSFQDEALHLISEQAREQKTGARGLSAVLESCLRPFKFELPSSNVKKLEVTAELVRNPTGVLHQTLGIH